MDGTGVYHLNLIFEIMLITKIMLFINFTSLTAKHSDVLSVRNAQKQQLLLTEMISCNNSRTDSPAPVCQGHPHRFGAQSPFESFVPLASQHPSDKHTLHCHPAFSSSGFQSYQRTVSLARTSRRGESSQDCMCYLSTSGKKLNHRHNFFFLFILKTRTLAVFKLKMLHLICIELRTFSSNNTVIIPLSNSVSICFVFFNSKLCYFQYSVLDSHFRDLQCHG